MLRDRYTPQDLFALVPEACVGYQPHPQREQQDLPGRQPRLPLHFLVGRHPRRSQPQRVGTISGRPSSTA